MRVRACVRVCVCVCVCVDDDPVAGGGNFGVVSSFVLKVHQPNSAKLFAAEVCYENSIAR